MNDISSTEVKHLRTGGTCVRDHITGTDEKKYFVRNFR